MEKIDIKYAIDFLNKMGYSWNGEIIGKGKPTTIEEFFYPVIVSLNGEEKGLIFYDECDNQPNCIIYKFKDHSLCVIEKDLTNEWIEHLKENNIKF